MSLNIFYSTQNTNSSNNKNSHKVNFSLLFIKVYFKFQVEIQEKLS